MMIRMMTVWCLQAYGLNSFKICFNSKPCDIWEGNMIQMSEI